MGNVQENPEQSEVPDSSEPQPVEVAPTPQTEENQGETTEEVAGRNTETTSE